MTKLKAFIYTLLMTPMLVACSKPTENLQEFTAEGIHPGNETNYNLSLKMTEDELFYVDASIEIKNTSADHWETIDLYFIPNMFTEENSPYLGEFASIDITSMKIDNEDTDYSLTNDHLSIPLNNKVNPDKTVVAEISYSFTMPDDGLRFTKNEDNYYLAQWYPMVPTYKNGSGWNKEDYKFRGESYHTFFSDFHITYDVPNHLTVVSSSAADEFPSKNKGTMTVKNVKEVFIALLDNPLMSEERLGKTNIRVFGWNQHKNEEILSTALKTVDYFNETIGPYPNEQLDIILHELGMEYPGVVTAGTIYRMDDDLSLDVQKNIVIHEIAHQWFYRTISNDPYHDSWLDEGLTQLATFLFLVDAGDLEFTFDYEDYDADDNLPVNLSLDEYQESELGTYVYSKPASMLGKIFEENGGKEAAENFFTSYYEHYKYKEVNTEEFVKFMKYQFDLNNDSAFTDWIKIDK